MFFRAYFFNAVFVLMVLFSGRVDAQAVCANQGASNVAGGVRVAKNCNGSLVSGYGTYNGAAEANAQGFANLGVSTGRYCGFQSNNVKTVGQFTYMVDFTCTGGREVTGYGNDATQAGINALRLASVNASGPIRCVTDPTKVFRDFVPGIIGGELVDYRCGNKFISGLGNTANEAGSSVSKFAELSVIWGVSCSISQSDIVFNNGVYLARYSCGGRIASAGDTFEDVSDIAYELGLIAAKSGRFCQTSMNLVNLSGSDVQVRYDCGTAQVIGVGYSVRTASLDAVSKMKVLWP